MTKVAKIAALLNCACKCSEALIENWLNGRKAAQHQVKQAALKLEPPAPPPLNFNFGVGGPAAAKRRAAKPGGVLIQVHGQSNAIDGMELVDADGNELQDVMNSSMSSGDQASFSFITTGPLPPEAKLKIVLLTDTHDVEVPFEFADIAITKPEKPKGMPFNFDPSKLLQGAGNN